MSYYGYFILFMFSGVGFSMIKDYIEVIHEHKIKKIN